MFARLTRLHLYGASRKFCAAAKKCTEKEPPCKPKCPETSKKPDCKPVECPENICCPPKKGDKAKKTKDPLDPFSDDCHSNYIVYKAIGLLLAAPLLIIATWLLTRTPNHEDEPRPPFVKYSYLRRRTKKFPWGDGNHSLFHNPRVNPLPEGYETPLPGEEEDED